MQSSNGGTDISLQKAQEVTGGTDLKYLSKHSEIKYLIVKHLFGIESKQFSCIM